MKHFSLLLAASLTALMTIPLAAQQKANPKQFAAGAHLGSLGVGVHAHYQPSYMFSTTGYLETFGVSVERQKAIANDPSSVLNAESNIFTGSANLNLHPFSNGLRVSGGLTFGQPELTGTSTYDSNALSNNDGTITYTIGAENSVQPYLGLGYSAYRGGNNRLYFHGDIGALFVNRYQGSAVANLNCGTKAIGLQAACNTEQAIVQNQASNEAADVASKLPEIYPVIRLGFGIKF